MAVDDSYTKVLLHFNGADGSTTFTDESGKTWTRVGGAELDTAKYKWTSSAYFDGSSYPCITTPTDADFNFGSGDFTVDFWLAVETFVNVHTVFSDYTAPAAFYFKYDWTGALEFGVETGSGTKTIVTASSKIAADSTWHHIACTRNGNNLRLFFDGVPEATTDVTGLSVNTATTKILIGSGVSGNKVIGWVDEFRISKGIARWTSDFSTALPSSEYAAVTGVDSNLPFPQIEAGSGATTTTNLPKFLCEGATPYVRLDVNLPIFTGEATGQENGLATLDIVLPSFTCESGDTNICQLDSSLYAFLCEAENGKNATANMSLPLFEVSIRVGNGMSAELPLLSCLGTSIHGSICDGLGTLPLLVCESQVLFNNPSILNTSMKKFVCAATASDRPLGSTSTSLPFISMSAYASVDGRFDNYALRYVRP